VSQRIFLAGATGVVGRPLIPLLKQAGHVVWAATRDPGKAETLTRQGVTAVVVDVFDSAGLARAVLEARPEVVIHQLTDLPKRMDPAEWGAALARNARVRDEGTRNLVRAAQGAGARKIIAQSIAWVYAPGPSPFTEDSPLAAPGSVSVDGVISLEGQVLKAKGMEGVVLRLGRFYGPDTGRDAPGEPPSVHVEAAARAAWLAIDRARAGIYNIADPSPGLSTDKAIRELGWRADGRAARHEH
jgi:nucleoside-diphosphate-sugar epimerase